MKNIFVEGFRERTDIRDNRSVVTIDFSVRNVPEQKEGVLLLKAVQSACDLYSGSTYPPPSSSFFGDVLSYTSSYLKTQGNYTYYPLY